MSYDTFSLLVDGNWCERDATRRDAFVPRTAPARVVVRVRVRSLARAQCCPPPSRAVQTGEDLRRGTVAGVHRTQRASHDVITPLFPSSKSSGNSRTPAMRLDLAAVKPARDELSRAKERAQTHGAADGDEDGVHLDARARVVRQSFGSRCARRFCLSSGRSPTHYFRVSVRGRVVARVVVASRARSTVRTSGLNQRWANVKPLMLSSSSSSSGVRRRPSHVRPARKS